MKLRPPAVPLINIDPYFNVWSMADTLTEDCTRHWSGAPQPITGTVQIENALYCFMGHTPSAVPMQQKSLEIDLFSSIYQMEKDGICVTARIYLTCAFKRS